MIIFQYISIKMRFVGQIHTDSIGGNPGLYNSMEQPSEASQQLSIYGIERAYKTSRTDIYK